MSAVPAPRVPCVDGSGGLSGSPATSAGSPYCDIAPRHRDRRASRAPRPFHSSVYQVLPMPPLAWPAIPDAHGFPRAAPPIRPWIPGVSTPEGLILATASVMLAAEAFGPAGEQLVRALQGVATLAMTAAAAGIPAAALWIGDRLVPHG